MQDPQSQTAPRAARRQEILQQMLDEFLAQPAKFVPSCSPAQYTTNVHHYVWVKDCDNVSEAEYREMVLGQSGKAQASANAICELNANCPVAGLIKNTTTRDACENQKWEMDVRWTFVCMPKS